LLKTVDELNVNSLTESGKATVFEKTRFSMCTDEVLAHLGTEKMASRKSAVIFGVETHVCVQQTVLDLLERDYTVHVVADGVSSQRPMDRDVAIERLRKSGAFITTVESVMFELLRAKEAKEFKQISGLAKAYGDTFKK